MCREASSGVDELRAIDLLQTVPHIGMQLLVQRFYLEAEEEEQANYFFLALANLSLLNREPQRYVMEFPLLVDAHHACG